MPIHVSENILVDTNHSNFCRPHGENARIDTLTKQMVLAVDNEDETRMRRLLKEKGASIACVTELGPINPLTTDPMGSVLHLAANRGYTKIVEILQDNGVKVNLRSLLDHATPLLRACRKAHVATMRLLIQNGADVNATDKYGQTPLRFALASGNADAVMMLMQCGADTSAMDTRGRVSTQLQTTQDQNLVRQTGVLRHHVRQPRSHVDSVYVDGSQTDRSDQSDRRSGIFEAVRRVQMNDYNFFDNKMLQEFPTRLSKTDDKEPSQRDNQNDPKLPMVGFW